MPPGPQKIKRSLFTWTRRHVACYTRSPYLHPVRIPTDPHPNRALSRYWRLMEYIILFRFILDLPQMQHQRANSGSPSMCGILCGLVRLKLWVLKNLAHHKWGKITFTATVFAFSHSAQTGTSRKKSANICKAGLNELKGHKDEMRFNCTQNVRHDVVLKVKCVILFIRNVSCLSLICSHLQYM